MATATKTKKGTKHKAAAKSGNGASTLEYLQHAIEDIDHARQHAVKEVRSALDAALDRLSSATEVVEEHLTQRLTYADSDWSLARAAEQMVSGRYRHVVVLDGSEVVGILSMRDIVRCWTERVR